MLIEVVGLKPSLKEEAYKIERLVTDFAGPVVSGHMNGSC